MKKRLLILFCAFYGALQAVAQIPFDVKVPDINKFVKVTSTGVNLRQAPTTASPRLIFSASGDCLDCEPSLVWSSGTLGSNDQRVDANLLYAIGESSDGEWWNVQYYEGLYGDMSYNEKAYIMKKFCKNLKVRNLPLAAPLDKNIQLVLSGPYVGLCLEWVYGYGDCRILRIGRYVNGIYAFAYSIEFSNNETNETQFKIVNDFDQVSFGAHLFNDEGRLDLVKLANDTKVLNLLMNNLNKMRKHNVAYLGFEGDGNWYLWGEY